MKKKYIRPTNKIRNIGTETDVLTSSITVYDDTTVEPNDTRFKEGAKENHSLWDTEY